MTALKVVCFVSGTLRLIDFGSACFEDERVYTYIQSRFYRSPEVILGIPYDVGIDVWSFACILAELYTGHPLFPGENEAEQIQCIMEIMGVPPRRFLLASSRRNVFFGAIFGIYSWRISPPYSHSPQLDVSLPRRERGEKIQCII